MDTPNQIHNATVTASASASTPSPDSTPPPVRKHAHQESAIFSYINDLSPIKPVKAAHVATGFPGLSSPPGPCDLHTEATNPERSEGNHLLSGDLQQLEVCIEESRICPNVLGSLSTQSSKPLIDCEQDLSNFPSRRSHQYMTDSVVVDHENLAPRAGSSVLQSDNTPQSLNDYTGLKETNPQFGDKNDSRQDAADAMAASEATPELLEHNIEGQSSFSKIHGESDVVKGLNEIPSNESQTVESSSFVDHSSTEQYCELSVDQGVVHEEELDIASQSVQKTMLSGQRCQDDILTEQSSKLSVEGVVFKNVKGQHHRGLQKRCLRFDNAPQSFIARTGLSSLSDTISNNNYKSSGLEVTDTSCGRQLDNLTQPVTSFVSRRTSGSSGSTVCKPLGIGLHLNSIVSAMPIGGRASGTVMSLEKGSLIVPRGKSASVMGSYQPVNTHGLVSLNKREKLSESSNEIQPLATDSSFASQPSPIMMSSHDPARLKQNDCRPTLCGKRKSISEDALAVEELKQSSPKKKRKKTSATSDGEGCKRCNCKKTKCLKLYCDCFAAGIYCADTCACQGCFNRPEYEDTVLETRQQIESRNPLAFAPKIVRPLAESPADSNMDNGNSSTPSSGRHKRGCNCKKSMCLKKYCECYQANVGCSSGCRCEGCKNIYGRKEDFGKDVLSQELTNESYQATSTEALEWVGRQEGFLQTEMCDQQNFTPQTPAFQFSDRGTDVSRPQYPSERGYSSPETDFRFLQKTPEPTTRMSDNFDMTMKAYIDMQGMNYCHQDTVDEQTQPNASFRASDYPLSSKLAEWKTVPRAQLNSSLQNSMYQHCSPITPITQFGGSRLVSRLESDEKQYEALEDDTPEILKDACSPINAVKSTSPNKKRVSPPFRHSLGSGSSVGLKSGRKFILKAVPSFPPLTPTIDSKSFSPQSNTKIAGTRNDD